MLIVFRWWYWIGAAGVALFAHGAVESTLALKAGSEPIAVSVEDLASGKPLTQRWVRLDRLVALEPLGMAWRAKRRGSSKVLFPLAAPGDPIVSALASSSRPSSKSDLPGFAALHVFALRRGTTLGEATRDIASIEGVVFEFDELSTEEQNLLVRVKPDVDRDAARVVELDRQPKSLAFSVGVLIVGNVMLYVALRLFLERRAADAAKKGAAAPQPASS